MRPLELSLEGFTSFRKPQTIAFEELDLFAITGPTGSGKSSILDAMTFALYGQTMRIGREITELVSQGATLLKVQFRFSVKGVVYRVTRTWRNRGKTAESLAQLERQAGDEWDLVASGAREVPRAIEGAVGMDYDTFTRVIVLPQGKFDEFLKGDGTKRHELLRQLAGMQIFEEMKNLAAERYKGLAAEREALERQLGGLAIPEDAEVEAKARELADCEAALPRHEAAKAEAARELEGAEQLLEKITRLAALRRSREALAERAPEIEALKERLERARVAEGLAGPYSLAIEAKRQREKADAAARAAGTRLEAAQKALAERQSALEAAKARHAEEEPRLKARERALLEAKGLDEQRRRAAAELEEAERTLVQKQAEYRQALQERKQAAAEEQRANEEAQAAGAELEKNAPGGDRLATLTEAAPLLREWAHLDKQDRECKARREQGVATIAEARRTAEAARATAGEADAALAIAEKELAAAEASLAEATLHRHAAAVRQGLKPGDPCPVCAGTFPDPESLPALQEGAAVDLAGHKARVTEAGRRQRDAHRGLAEAEAFLKSAEAQLAEREHEAEAGAAALAEAEARLTELLATRQWEVRALEEERRALAERDKRHRQALATQQEAAARAAQARQAMAFAEKTLAAVEEVGKVAREETDRRKGELEKVQSSLEAITGGKPHAELLTALEAERQALEAALAAAQDAHQAAHGASLQAEEGDKQAREAALAATEQEARAWASWCQALAAAGLDEAGFLGARATAAEQAGWRQALEAHATETAQLEARVEELARDVGERAVDEGAIAAQRQALEEAQRALQALQATQVELRTWLAMVEAQRRTAAELLAQIAPVKEQEQVYATLKDDLGARKFQAYLLEHLQADLVDRATVILKELSDDRYVLRLVESQFQVEDNWNGGEVRKVRTLSGGETFAASLAMALALSERLAMGAELGSLFLDEGFGTLDQETLESVTQILESLRQKNRMIGVITHVRALGERLPTQIKVVKAPEGSAVLIEAL